MSRLVQNTTVAERRNKCVFSETFENASSIVSNSGILYGTPSVNFGAILNGTTDYLKYNLLGNEITASISLVLEFVPYFSTSEDQTRYLVDSSGIGSARIIIRKDNNASSNTLRLYLGSTNLIEAISEASYSPYWYVGRRNIIVVSAISGATNMWLNGVQLLNNDTTSFTYETITSLYFGASNAGISNFVGKILSAKISQGLLTAKDADAYYNNTVNSYVNEAILNLPMIASTHDPSGEHSNNLVANGDFTEWTADDPDGWIKSTENANNYITQVGNAARLVSDGTYIAIQQNILTVGKTYELTFEVLAVVSGSIQLTGGGTIIGSYNTTGIKTASFVCGASTGFVIKRAAACDITFTNVLARVIEPKTLDISGKNNNATLGDGVTSTKYPTKLPNRGYSFDGTTDYLNISALTSTSTNYTFVFIVSSTATASTIKYLFDSSSGRFIIGWNTDTTGKIGYYDGTWRSFSDAPRDGRLHTCIFVFNASSLTAEYYQDGVKTGSTLAYTPKNIGGTTALGSFNLGSNNWFSGKMHDVKIFDTALSPIQIQDLHTKMIREVNYNG